jgi:hypothetical protein
LKETAWLPTNKKHKNAIIGARKHQRKGRIKKKTQAGSTKSHRSTVKEKEKKRKKKRKKNRKKKNNDAAAENAHPTALSVSNSNKEPTLEVNAKETDCKT